MFDANMRHLYKGKDFFAELSGITKEHPLHKLGISGRGRVVLCKMLSDEDENPVVRFYNKEDYIDISDSESGMGSWIVYSGNKDLTGFINDKSKEAAKQILEGLQL